MTKIEAMIQLINDNGGSADWDTIYSNIEKYYPNAKKSEKWQEGLRGVLYRGIKNNQLFRTDVGLFSIEKESSLKILENNFFLKLLIPKLVSKVQK